MRKVRKPRVHGQLSRLLTTSEIRTALFFLCSDGWCFTEDECLENVRLGFFQAMLRK